MGAADSESPHLVDNTSYKSYEMAQPQEISHARRAAFQVMAGGSAGFLEVCIMQPLDVVKTRIQIQATPTVARSAVSEVSVWRG